MLGEGKAVAGASVSITSIYDPAEEKLDGYLASWQKQSMPQYYLPMPRKPLHVPLDAITGRVTTDMDGNFKLHGAGGERMVHVSMSGPGIARSIAYVITRPNVDARPYNLLLQRSVDFDPYASVLVTAFNDGPDVLIVLNIVFW